MRLALDGLARQVDGIETQAPAISCWSLLPIPDGSSRPTTPANVRCAPAVIQRKVTNGYRAMWTAKGEADVRTVVDTARLRTGDRPFSGASSTRSRHDDYAGH
jgi:transposase